VPTPCCCTLRSGYRANRLNLPHHWSANGGALAIFSGYLNFQGVDGNARWHRTAMAQALPVVCLPFDYRIEWAWCAVSRLVSRAGLPMKAEV